jgi:hypothetical protein
MEKKNRAHFNYTTFGYIQTGATVPLKVMDSSWAMQKGFRKAAGKCLKVWTASGQFFRLLEGPWEMPKIKLTPTGEIFLLAGCDENPGKGGL